MPAMSLDSGSSSSSSSDSFPQVQPIHQADSAHNTINPLRLLDSAWVRIHTTETASGGFGTVSLNACIKLPKKLDAASPFYTVWRDLHFEMHENDYECVVKEVLYTNLGNDLIYDCKHPNIIKTYGFYRPTPDTIRVVMEKGIESLQDWTGPAPESRSLQQRLKVVQHIAEAVRFLGSAGIIHRDVTPRNILRFGNGKKTVWKLADFGLARHSYQEHPMERFQPHNCPGGTPGFTDPLARSVPSFRELFKMPYGLRTEVDVYSLGKLVGFLFAQQRNAAAVEAACCNPELHLRLTSAELQDPWLLTVLSSAEDCPVLPNTVQRDRNLLRMLLMRFYHLRFAEKKTETQPSLPFAVSYARTSLHTLDNPSDRFAINELFDHPSLSTTPAPHRRVVAIHGIHRAGKSSLAQHMGREQITGSMKNRGAEASIVAVIVVPLQDRSRLPRKLALFDRHELLRWCLQSKDDVDGVCALVDRVGWGSILWIIDTRTIDNEAIPFLKRHLGAPQDSFMRHVLILGSFAAPSLPPLDCNVPMYCIAPLQEPELSQFAVVLRPVVAASARIKHFAQHAIIAQHRQHDETPCVEMTPFLIDAALAAPGAKIGLAEMLLHAATKLVRCLDPDDRWVDHAHVMEAAAVALMMLRNGVVELEPNSATLGANPLFRRRFGAPREQFEFHHPSFAEVFYAVHLLHLADTSGLNPYVLDDLNEGQCQFVGSALAALLFAPDSQPLIANGSRPPRSLGKRFLSAIASKPLTARTATAIVHFFKTLEQCAPDRELYDAMWAAVKAAIAGHFFVPIFASFINGAKKGVPALEAACCSADHVMLFDKLRTDFAGVISIERVVSRCLTGSPNIIAYCIDQGLPTTFDAVMLHASAEDTATVLRSMAHTDAAAVYVWQGICNASSAPEPVMHQALNWLNEDPEPRRRDILRRYTALTNGAKAKAKLHLGNVVDAHHPLASQLTAAWINSRGSLDVVSGGKTLRVTASS